MPANSWGTVINHSRESIFNQLVFHDDCIQAPRNPRVSKRNSELGTKLNWVVQVFSSLDMALQVAVSQVIKTGNGKC